MRRQKGIFGSIMGLISALIIIGISMAVLKQFNWDIGAAITWLFKKAVDFVNAVSNYLTNLPAFRNLFAK